MTNATTTIPDAKPAAQDRKEENKRIRDARLALIAVMSKAQKDEFLAAEEAARNAKKARVETLKIELLTYEGAARVADDAEDASHLPIYAHLFNLHFVVKEASADPNDGGKGRVELAEAIKKAADLRSKELSGGFFQKLVCLYHSDRPKSRRSVYANALMKCNEYRTLDADGQVDGIIPHRDAEPKSPREDGNAPRYRHTEHPDAYKAFVAFFKAHGGLDAVASMKKEPGDDYYKTPDQIAAEKKATTAAADAEAKKAEIALKDQREATLAYISNKPLFTIENGVKGDASRLQQIVAATALDNGIYDVLCVVTLDVGTDRPMLKLNRIVTPPTTAEALSKYNEAKNFLLDQIHTTDALVRKAAQDAKAAADLAGSAAVNDDTTISPNLVAAE